MNIEFLQRGLEKFRGWARMVMLMKPHLGLSYLGILDLSTITSQ